MSGAFYRYFHVFVSFIFLAQWGQTLKCMTLTQKYKEKKPNKRDFVWEMCVSNCICPQDNCTFLL